MFEMIKLKTEVAIAKLREIANSLDKEGKKELLMILDYTNEETNKFIEELRTEVNLLGDDK